MSVIDVIRHHVGNARGVFLSTMAGVDAAMAYWLPPGTAHPIGEKFIHALWWEDLYIQRLLQKKPLLWEADGHDKKIGLKFNPMATTEEARVIRVDPARLKDYAQAVAATTASYLQGLHDEDLDRKVEGVPGSGEHTVASLLVERVAGHLHQTAGEISELKGIQGAKGYPF